MKILSLELYLYWTPALLSTLSPQLKQTYCSNLSLFDEFEFSEQSEPYHPSISSVFKIDLLRPSPSVLLQQRMTKNLQRKSKLLASKIYFLYLISQNQDVHFFEKKKTRIDTFYHSNYTLNRTPQKYLVYLVFKNFNIHSLRILPSIKQFVRIKYLPNITKEKTTHCEFSLPSLSNICSCSNTLSKHKLIVPLSLPLLISNIITLHFFRKSRNFSRIHISNEHSLT